MKPQIVPGGIPRLNQQQGNPRVWILVSDLPCICSDSAQHNFGFQILPRPYIHSASKTHGLIDEGPLHILHKRLNNVTQALCELHI